jgi:hypothetical protein
VKDTPAALPSTALIGAAGTFYVASELSRRGMIVLPTTRNTAAYDLLVVTPDGRRHANIQVKTSFMRVSGFPMPLPEKIHTGRHDFYVFVRWDDEDNRFQGFMLTGRQTHAVVQAHVRQQKARMKKGTRKVIFPGVHADPNDRLNGGAWQRKWKAWKL